MQLQLTSGNIIAKLILGRCNMEGLIPIVYKAIKRNKTRRKYKCLSSGATQTYNIPDFYITGHTPMTLTPPPPPPEKVSRFHGEGNNHRRHKSVEEFSGGGFFSPEKAPRLSKEAVGFRSHRMFSFSCINGA
ncbi:hypothetical protein HHK36_013389 [Tetracentron sinense]|uniref:Uncharacterized protein n=1 Tax=Tetracentron sinense TaxID=13715 RepID=A0A835DGD9_TETSI|nr:hypothetical protein HHK36_013389 [Tetracentron sinense]